MDRFVLTEKSLFRIVGFMQAIGLPTPKKKVALNLRQIIGKVLEVDIEDGEPYNGRVKSEVRGYMRATKSSKDEVQDIGDADEEDVPAPDKEDVSEEDVNLDELDLG